MGYSDKENMVRVDFFKPSGKWYTSVAVEWKIYKGRMIHDAFREAISEYTDKFEGFTAVCLHPYHEHEHPLLIVV